MPKYILKEMPDMQGDGKRKIYPKLDAFRLLDTEDFVKEIHNYHHVYSTSLIESVLMDVADVLRRKLTDGYTVKIDDIGTFSQNYFFFFEVVFFLVEVVFFFVVVLFVTVGAGL